MKNVVKLLCSVLLTCLSVATIKASSLSPAPSAPTISYCDSLGIALANFDSLNPGNHSLDNLANGLNTTFGGSHYDSVTSSYITNDGTYWYGQITACGLSFPSIINCALADTILHHFYAQYPQWRYVCPTAIWTTYLNINGASNGYWNSAQNWTLLLGLCGYSYPVPDTPHTRCDSLNDAIGLYNVSFPSGSDYNTFTSTLNEMWGYSGDINYWRTVYAACGDSFPTFINCAQADTVMSHFYATYPQYTTHAPTFLWVNYLNQNSPTPTKFQWYSAQDWITLLGWCGISYPAPDTLANFCDSLQVADSLYIYTHPSGGSPYQFNNLLSSELGIYNSYTSWISILSGCGLSCPHTINCSYADSLMTAFKTQNPSDSSHCPPFLWTGYLSSNNVQGDYSSYSPQDWMTMLSCCGIGYPAPDTLGNYCDSLQAAVTMYNNMYPNGSQSWVYVSFLNQTFSMWGHDSSGVWVGNTLQSWYSLTNGCSMSCPKVISCTIADSVLTNFYTAYPLYTTQAPAFVWTSYLNTNYGNRNGSYTTQDWTTLLGCCGTSVPFADTVRTYCDSMRIAVNLYTQQYPSGSNLWTFTGILNSYLPNQHYDSASNQMVNNTDSYWLAKVKSCGISCPSIVNCSTVSSLMTTFYSLYPQYDSVAPVVAWSSFLNDNGAGQDNMGNGWTYSPDQWLGLLNCCSITSPIPVALGSHCDTLNAILTTMQGLGTVNYSPTNLVNAINEVFGWQHYDTATSQNIDNTFSYWFTQMLACGDSCMHIVGCDSINTAISQLNSYQIIPDSSRSYSLPFIESYLTARFQNYQLDPVSWHAILQCCHPLYVNYSDSVLNHCDSLELNRFALQYNLPIDSCLPYWVYNYFLSNGLGQTISIYQFCSALDSCNIKCLPICTSSLSTSCDSVNSMYQVYRQALASEQHGGVPANDPGLLQNVYSILYGYTSSTGQILAKISSCDNSDCIVVNFPLAQSASIFNTYSGCIPVRVFTTAMNYNAGEKYTYTQWCNLFAHCGDTCPNVCDSVYSFCDSLREATDMANRVIAVSGGTTDSGAYMSIVFSAYFGRSISALNASIMQSMCNPVCDSFVAGVSVNSQNICTGTTATLTATGGATYLWSTSDTTASIHETTAGTYTVTVTNSSTCTATVSGTVTVTSTPFPPAAPVFLSACSDSPYAFVFDDVTAWGDNLQWSYTSSFTSYTTEYPDYSSYFIEPFTISVPGDSSVTVWFRTITSPAGCISDSVSAILETNRLPIQRNIYAIDTIVPQDSTTIVVVPNSQSGILYTLQIGYTVVASASGTGDTIYLSTPPIDTPTIIDVYATNTSSTCQRHLYSGRYSSYRHVDSISQIYVTVYHSTPIVTCQADTLYISVTNNTSVPVDTVILHLYINTPDFSLLDTAINSRIGVGVLAHTLPAVTGSGSSYQVRLDTIPADSTWTFSLILYTNCSAIPNSIPTSGGIIIPKDDTLNRVYVWVSSLHDIVGINNTPDVTSGNPFHIVLDSIQYPIFDVDLQKTTAFDSGVYTYDGHFLNKYNGCASLGDTIVRRSYFINKGSAIFTGGISIRDSTKCDGMTLIGAKVYFTNKIDTLSSADSASLLGTGFEYNLSRHGDTVGISSDLILEETFVVSACLGLDCESKVIMTWGCDTTNLCKTRVPTPYTYLTQNCKKPVLRISRILPPSNGGNWYWDSSCTNTFTKWEFEVQNADTSSTTTLTNVHVILSKNDIGSYSFVNFDPGFSMGFANPLYGSPDSLPASDSLTYTLIPLMADTFTRKGRFIPACLTNPNNDAPILSIDMRIARFRKGDKFFFSFYTYQCCPSDIELFDNMFSMNHWTITSYGFYCGSDGNDSIPAAPYAPAASIPPYYDPFAGRDQTTAISPYYYDGGADFGITQLFTPSVSSMSVPDTAIFCVENTFILADNAFRDYQLLFQYGHNNNADSPTFRLIVDFDTDTGLYVSQPDSISISGLGYRWYGTTLANNLFHTEVAFDIHDLGLLDTAIVGPHSGASAFKTFFEGSNICFPLSSYCPAVQPKVGVRIRTYLEPRWSLHCDTCKIPLYQDTTAISVHCPGCTTPGIIVHGSSMRRINFGLPDDNNIGLASSLSPITPSYSHYGQLNDYSGVVGDAIRSYILEDFIDGDSTTGVSYAAWQRYWTALGNTNAYFQYLFFEHNIPFSSTSNMDLHLIMDTLYYTPAGDTGALIIPIPITTSNVVHVGDNFIYRISIDEIRAILSNDSLSFKPGDVYRLFSYYTICGNVNLSGYNFHSSGAIQSYFTTPPNSGLLSHFQFDAGAGDYFATHKDTSHIIPNDSILSPNLDLYYRCEGFTSDFYFYYVEYTVRDAYADRNSWRNDTRCLKNIDMSLTAQIIGPITLQNQYIHNNFPWEFKPVPGICTGNSININDTSAPYAYLIKSIGQCYQVNPDYTQTDFYTHPGGGNDMLYIQTETAGFRNTIAAPYERFTFPNMFAYATPSNYSGNTLLIGDEYFSQLLDFQLTLPVCIGCP